MTKQTLAGLGLGIALSLASALPASAEDWDRPTYDAGEGGGTSYDVVTVSSDEYNNLGQSDPTPVAGGDNGSPTSGEGPTQ